MVCHLPVGRGEDGAAGDDDQQPIRQHKGFDRLPLIDRPLQR
jgi:hypothetical protein